MAHIMIEAAEALLDKEMPVLDHGFVKLVDYMGGDHRIVEAARVSYAGGTKGYREDRQLIRYLMRNRHTSPFEQVILTFHVKLPIFVARQWIRHRTARVNEISGRYSVLDNEFYVPDAEQIGFQSNKNKQCRDSEGMPEELAAKIRQTLTEGQTQAYRDYEALLEQGLAREVARINLPVSIYTQWYWEMDLHNLLHFLSLRLHPHAQWEIRQYAEKVADCVRAVAPIAYEAFEEFVQDGLRLSRTERDSLTALLTDLPADALPDKLLAKLKDEAGQ